MSNQEKERDDTLLRMLRTKPKPHKPLGRPKPRKAKIAKKKR